MELEHFRRYPYVPIVGHAGHQSRGVVVGEAAHYSTAHKSGHTDQNQQQQQGTQGQAHSILNGHYNGPLFSDCIPGPFVARKGPGRQGGTVQQEFIVFLNFYSTVRRAAG